MRLTLILQICFLFVANVATQTVHQSLSNATNPDEYVIENFSLIRSNNPDTALYYLNRIIEKPDNSQNLYLLARAYQKRGILHYYIGEFDKERSDLLQSLRLAEELGDLGLQGDILKELCVSENRQSRFQSGIRYGYRSIDLCSQVQDSFCVASAQRNLGRTYLKLENRDSADYFIFASYELKLALKDSFGLPYALNDLAELAMLDEEPAKAKSHLLQSADIRSALGDSSGLAITLNNIGEILLMQSKGTEAIPYFKESIALSGPLRFIDLHRHSLNQIGLAYQLVGDYKSAYENELASQVIKDSLYTDNKAKSISELQIKYETEKATQLIKDQQTELHIQRLIGFSVLSVLLLVGGFIYYRIYQRRKFEKTIQDLEVKDKIHRERERISRDLHDSVGSNLTRIITDLDILAAPAGVTNEVAITQNRIASTRTFTRQTIGLLRDTIWALNKDSFRCSEWANKIENHLANYLAERIDWQVVKNIKQDHQLSANEVLNLHRIVQEASQNMLKHAQAEHFSVTIATTKLATSLVIKDDGVGMNLTPSKLDDHYGLYNMRRRAEDIGANFEITAAAKKGFEIKVFLPVNKQL